MPQCNSVEYKGQPAIVNTGPVALYLAMNYMAQASKPQNSGFVLTIRPFIHCQGFLASLAILANVWFLEGISRSIAA